MLADTNPQQWGQCPGTLSLAWFKAFEPSLAASQVAHLATAVDAVVQGEKMANEATFNVPDKLWSVKSEDMIHRKLRNLASDSIITILPPPPSPLPEFWY